VSHLYPLKFKSIFKERIWGGRRLESILGKKLPRGKRIGESWEIADLGSDCSIVQNGPLRGKTLHQLILSWKEKLVGRLVYRRYGNQFPLLLKFLDAQENLSIQVHPNDLQARRFEKRRWGKSEAWYILSAQRGAHLITGFRKTVSVEFFKEAIANQSLGRCVQYVPSHNGDVFFIPAGTLHGISGGNLIYEIQQNSDSTYRVYDYGRVGRDGRLRDLHVDQSLVVSDLSGGHDYKIKRVDFKEGKNEVGYLVACQYFCTERLTLRETYRENILGKQFYLFSCIQGKGQLEYQIQKKNKSLGIVCGETVMVPAILEKVQIKPRGSVCQILKSYVPDLKELIEKIKRQGADIQQIKRLNGDNV